VRIHLSNSAFLGNIDAFVQRINTSQPELLEITANKRWISLHPVVLAMVAAQGLVARDVRCEEFEAKSRHYLERMGLFRFLRISSDIKIIEHEPAGRFIPLRQVQTNEELSAFITEIVPLLHLDPVQAEPIRYVVSELVRNVLEHAHAQHGAIVCAQYYKKSNTIRIGIVDTGAGIRKTISAAHDVKDDLDALRLALTPGITGTTAREGGTEYNAGAGLFFIKSIAQANKNFFVLYSGRALYKLLKSSGARLHGDPYRDRHSTMENCPPWQGTIVGVDLSLAPTQEFTTLLDRIREEYTKNVRERKRSRNKEARFV